MALTTTTLSSAVVVTSNSIVVASATGFAAGSWARIDGEAFKVAQNYVSGTTIPVLRGQDGTMTSAHASGANVTVGLASDFALAPAGTNAAVTNPVQPAMPLYSYSATGAMTASAGIHQLNGTGALAMTLASPTKDQDGQLIIIVSNGKAAHTVTCSAGFGALGAGSTVLSFRATQQQAVQAIASNGAWCLLGHVAGAATVAGVGLA